VSAGSAQTQPPATGQLVYVYAILRATALDALDASQLTGIAGEPIALVESSGLAAVTSAVPAEEFDEAPLNQRLRDLAWLGPHAAAHQAVNAQLHAVAEAVLPLSFGAIFRSKERVAEVLSERERELEARLSQVAGREEWVAALQRSHALAVGALERVSVPVQQLQREMAAAGPGRAYLLGRRLEQLKQEEARRLDAQAAEEATAAVEGVSDQLHREALVRADGPTAEDLQVLARMSLLVSRRAAPTLLRAAEAFNATWRDRGYTLHLTGPWPPYRFGGLQLGQ
jgi:hypothetical protein